MRTTRKIIEQVLSDFGSHKERVKALNDQGYRTSRGNPWTTGAFGAEVYRQGLCKYKQGRRKKLENKNADDLLLDAVIQYRKAKDNLINLIRNGQV